MAQGSRHLADRAAELAGAIALGSGTAASVWQVAPGAGVDPAMLAGFAGVAGLLTGWLIVRLTPGTPASAGLAPFAIAPIETLNAEDLATDELLLVDEIPKIDRDSRVVELFEPPHPATPGDLQARIAAHLGDPPHASQASEPPTPWDGSPAIPDASDALHAALADIRRSLRAR